MRACHKKENRYEKNNKGAGIGFELLSGNTDEYGLKGVLIKALNTYVLPYISKSKLLEIGSGSGNLTVILSKLFSETVIVEPNRKFFENVTNLIKCKGFNARWEDVEIGKDKFDLILAIHILYYIPKKIWLRQIERMISVLGENGKLVIVLQSKESHLYAFPNKFLKRESRINSEELMQVLHDARIKFTSRKLKTEIWSNNKKKAEIIGEFLLDAHSAPISEKAALDIWEQKKGNKYIVSNIEDMIIIDR